MKPNTTRRLQRGFTLIEIMLVVVIIGIISSIAIPFYSRASAKAYRSEALVTISKLELYFKNLYESQGNYNGPSVVTATSGSDVMPDPNNTIAVGQGADWKPASGGGWEDVPFPPQGNIRMRYQYLLNTLATPPTVTIQACGNFPGFGTPTLIFGTKGVKCNYIYTEIMVGSNAGAISENPINSIE
jgi:prepilin-type N-terminal cleavage/methylation domain-containing protein